VSHQRRSALRTAIFSAVPVLALALGVNLVVERAEDAGVIDTHRVDDQVQFIEGDLLEVEHGPFYVTTTYAEGSMVPQRFPVDKGDGWRILLSGGSFVQGSPYTHQGHGVEFPGGIATWLREDLRAQHPDTRIDVVNLAAGGQNSNRVLEVVQDTLRYDPDLYFVATCNNEGAITPSRLQRLLQDQGGFRLLQKHLRPAPSIEDRSVFTPQDEDTAQLTRQYRRNIEGIAQAAREAGVPLILATLPIHRSWTGDNVSNPLG
jgi:hypothetical protein